MSDVPVTAMLTMECWCVPPKHLVADSEHQSARCDECGCEILVGVSYLVPRLRLVEVDE